ncbi:MAG: hypothetical protein JXA82_12040 [Sedimentisphaerales bacterium]|nr:hypothetical protein [Sedimentisphaerales bacterium]
MKPCLLTALLMFSAFVSAQQSREKTPGSEEPSSARWEKEIRVFEEWDKKNSFPRDAVLFVGSSSIRLWPTCESFPGFPVINRGFGGAFVADVTYYADRIAIPYKPTAICFFAGGNDIASGRTPQQVVEDAAAFAKHIWLKLPTTPILFLSIKPSPQRMAHWPQIKEANKFLQDMCSRDDRLSFVDVATPLLDLEETPIPSLYQSDQLHLSETGYRIWTLLVTPALTQCIRINESNTFAPGDSTPPAASPNPGVGNYIASKTSKIFHTSTCSSAKRITEANLVRFDSREQALRSGRKPCKLCKP